MEAWEKCKEMLQWEQFFLLSEVAYFSEIEGASAINQNEYGAVQ